MFLGEQVARLKFEKPMTYKDIKINTKPNVMSL
jgi:hypothetical protein